MEEITFNRMLRSIDKQKTCLKKRDGQLTKAKAIIKDLLSVLPKENIEGVYEVTEEAEQFLREVGE